MENAEGLKFAENNVTKLVVDGVELSGEERVLYSLERDFADKRVKSLFVVRNGNNMVVVVNRRNISN